MNKKYSRTFHTDRGSDLLVELRRRVSCAHFHRAKFSVEITCQPINSVPGKYRLTGPERHSAEIDEIIRLFERKQLN